MLKLFGIPLIVFQYANTNDELKSVNPEFSFFCFNENDCENFIKNNYSIFIYNAYKSLIPVEYKRDLWIYCILYKYGGIYIDTNFKPQNNFKLINFINNNYFTSEIDYYNNKKIIYTGFIISHPNNIIFLKAINHIVENINKNYYGISASYPTGGGLLASIINPYITNMTFIDNTIIYNNHVILQKNNENENLYKYLWNSKKIYLKMPK
jgi:mannosyltransferase OCH1-like enzyme